jgi:hypothetical protein
MGIPRTTKHDRAPGVKAPRGRPASRRKPLREKLFRAGITYRQVAAVAERSYRTVRAHVDSLIHSPAVDAAIRKLLNGGPA